MKRFTILFISAIMLIVTSCGPSAADLEVLSKISEGSTINYQNFDDASTARGYSSYSYQHLIKVKNHDWYMSYTYNADVVFVHSPDCELCKQQRKQELDSLYIRIKDLIEKR
jgi:hypothetical protein